MKKLLCVILFAFVLGIFLPSSDADARPVKIVKIHKKHRKHHRHHRHHHHHHHHKRVIL